MAKKKLTARQRKFISEYLLCLNATQAAKNAGYSKDTAKQMGSENLSKPAILEVLRPILKEALDADKDILKNRVIDQLKRIAFADVDNPDPLATAARDEYPMGNGTRKTFKLFDKNSALEKLMKYLDLLDETVNIKSDTLIAILPPKNGSNV